MDWSEYNDSHLLYRQLEGVIKFRRNSVLDGSVRDKYVMMQLSNYDKWRGMFGYGYRWIVETVFSVFKRIFGEYVSAKKFNYIVNELMHKIRIYNLLIGMMSIK